MMHLIINSLDTRGWMSDGVSSRAVEKHGRKDRVGGEKGFVAKAEVGGEWRSRGEEEGRVNEEGEGKSEGRERWEASDCRQSEGGRGRVLGVGRKVGSSR